jgi:hypothetical protein
VDKRYKRRMERYWREMDRSAHRSLASLDFESWFDFWHTHLDWRGRGSRCRENREAEIHLGYKVFEAAHTLSMGATKQIQVWLTVCHNSLDDAVYLHSENPNGTAFPYEFDGVEWDSVEQPVLNEIIDKAVYKIGKIQYDSGDVFIVTLRTLFQ